MTTDLLNPINCACFNTRRAARRITQLYDQALKPTGLQATQFTLLSMLAFGGGKDGIVMTSLANQLGMDRTTLTRNLALIERENLAVITPGEDRRERLIRITSQGQRKVKSAMPYWQAAQEEVLTRLGKSGLKDFLKLSHQIDMS